MKPSTTQPVALVLRASRTWTCAKCRNHPLPSALRAPRLSASPARRFASSFTREGSRHHHQQEQGQAPPRSSRRKGAVLLAATGGAAGAGLLAFTDDIKQSYDTAERSGRVAAALFVCINDYRTTLNQREKITDEEEQSRLLKDCHQRCADRTLKVLEKNGGIYIKLGQHLSAMNYLLPSEWTTTFIPLQDRCPVSSFESIQQMFKQDTGGDLFDFFSEFSPEPIGAASLAQVHLATLKETGAKVAVKFQHPTLAQWAPLDLALTKFTFQTMARFFPEYDLSWLSSEMEVSLPQELDFTREAANARRTKEYFSHIPKLPLVIPEVLWAKERILVMANESGHRLDDLEYLDSHGIDRDEVSAALARIFNEMIFGEGAPLHCDPHGGNISIRLNESRRRGPYGGSNFDVILYDHGLYRDIPMGLRRSYAKMWLAVIDGDMPRMKKYVHEVAGIGEDKFPLFASAITGRDFTALAARDVRTGRSADEKQNMGDALQDGLLADLVQMLGRVPRVILLILKTNDLTRSLDEGLRTRRGPVRSFLILARYCARTVLLERLEEVQGMGSAWWPGNAARLAVAWLGFWRVEVRLGAFELWIGVRRALGMGTAVMGLV